MRLSQTWQLIPVIAVASTVPFFTPPYYLYIAIIAIYYAILASSWNLLAGYTGQISFAHAALSSISAYTSALLVINFKIPIVAGIIIGSLTSFSVGYLLGKVCLKLRGPYLALTTLAFSEIFRIVVTIEYDYTRGSLSLNVPPLFESRGFVQYYYVALALFAAVMLVNYFLLRSWVGCISGP